MVKKVQRNVTILVECDQDIYSPNETPHHDGGVRSFHE